MGPRQLLVLSQTCEYVELDVEEIIIANPPESMHTRRRIISKLQLLHKAHVLHQQSPSFIYLLSVLVVLLSQLNMSSLALMAAIIQQQVRSLISL